MARRADPERIHQARRAANRNGLTDYGTPLEDAKRWCDAWETEAAASRNVQRNDRDYWTIGAAWIAEQRAARRQPETQNGPDPLAVRTGAAVPDMRRPGTDRPERVRACQPECLLNGLSWPRTTRQGPGLPVRQVVSERLAEPLRTPVIPVQITATSAAVKTNSTTWLIVGRRQRWFTTQGCRSKRHRLRPTAGRFGRAGVPDP
jgi:hypothetical protein